MTFFGITPYKQGIYHSFTIVGVIKLSERRLELFTTMLLFIPLNEEAHPILSIKVRLELFETKHLLKGIP